MITKEIDIKVNTGDAEKDVKSLDKSIEGVGSAGKESGEKASKGIEKVDKTAKATEKSSKLAGLGVKLIGTALKAVGIGVILALFAKFTQILTSNKKVSDAISTTFETISIVLSEVVTALVNSFTAISDATNGFEGFRKVIGGLLTLALTPLKVSFFAIKLALQEAQLAFEESIFGDGDQTTIDALNVKIKQTQKDLSDVAAEALIAGKQVADNVGKAITEVAAFTTIASDEIGKISIKSASEQAKLNTQLANSAILAEARIQGLIEKYDREAELLRQIRDDDKKSIADRIKANEDLGKKLDEQLEKQKEQANIRVAAAIAAQKTASDQVQAQAEVIKATNELAAIEASVTGFRAEQLTNRNALDKERIEILRTLNEIGKNDLELAKSEAEQVRDDRLIQIELQVADETEKFRLLEQARLDFDNTIKDLDDAEQERLKKIAAEELKRVEETAAANKAISDAEAKAKKDNVDSYLGTIQKAGELAGQETEAGKALAVAGALINTYQGISAGVALGYPAAIPAVIAAATVGFKSVKDIIAVKTPNGGGGGGGNTISGGQESQPAFNLVGRSNVNQLQTGLEQQETAPVRAFVVGSSVTSQQEADRATQSQASFG
tara:strand:+ start:8157 stop:9992 length:1836 start_codon:yes stop_codon:yes gene_type:complete